MPTTALITRFSAWQSLRGLAPRTIDRRAWTIRRWVASVDDIWHATRSDIECFLAALPTAQTRYSLRADLHQFYRWAIREGHTDLDPTLLVDPPRLPRRSPTPVSESDVRLAIAAAHGTTRTMIMLAAMAGLRVSEVAAIRREDAGDGVLVVRGGKGGDRVVPLSPALAEELARYQPGPLWPTMTGPAVSTRIRRHFRSIGITARPHDLRHSFATQAARLSGGNMVLVQQLMGHQSLAATQRYMGWAAPGADVVTRMYQGDAA